MRNRFGYACINRELSEQGITVNKGMQQTSFLKRCKTEGKQKVLLDLAQRTASNLEAMHKVLQWNLDNDIDFYRMSSTMFTLEHLYELEELPGWESIQKMLKFLGDFATDNDIRLSFHPGPFNVLASKSESVVKKSINNLNFHSRIMDEMGLSRSHFNPINIHVGGAFGDRKSAIERFAKNWDKLEDGTKSRLNIENDDRPNLFSALDLMYLHELIEIPICFDYLHHQFCHSEQPEEEAVKMCFETWEKGINPVVHVASSKLNEDANAKHARAHAEYLYEEFDNYGLSVDYMVEAKAKEQALLKWRTEYKMIKS